jgi:putative oxidoreductase
MKDIADLLGRICIALIFVYEAIDTILFYNKNKHTMTEYGITWNQDFLMYTVVIFLVIGALMVLIGYYANIGAIFLLAYWLPFTLIVYSFWNDPPSLQRLSTLNFMQNLAVCGGLLLLAANGAGKYSVRRLIHVMRLPD